jgi:hypothetical protein
MDQQIGFYTFSFENPTRKANMEERFQKENIEIEFVPCVQYNDSRLENAPPSLIRNWSIMWNHLDMLKAFLESKNNYGIFCEDDIFIRKGLKAFLPELVSAYERRNLEILLLGCLTTHKPAGLIVDPNFSSSGTNLLYLNYEDNIWGAHMYMLNRKTAEKFLDLYSIEYAKTTLLSTAIPFFSPDWTLTKIGSRALVYPMMGIEEGIVNTKDIGQVEFHKACFNAHYNSEHYH